MLKSKIVNIMSRMKLSGQPHYYFGLDELDSLDELDLSDGEIRPNYPDGPDCPIRPVQKKKAVTLMKPATFIFS